MRLLYKNNNSRVGALQINYSRLHKRENSTKQYNLAMTHLMNISY